MNTSGCFGRVTDKVFLKCNTLDDLINLINTTNDGQKIDVVGSIDSFKSRLESYKNYLNENIPELTLFEILKFDKFYHKIKDIYSWVQFDYLLMAIEFELRKENEQLAHKVD